MNKQVDRQTDRQANTDREAGRQTYGQMDDLTVL